MVTEFIVSLSEILRFPGCSSLGNPQAVSLCVFVVFCLSNLRQKPCSLLLRSARPIAMSSFFALDWNLSTHVTTLDGPAYTGEENWAKEV